MGPEKRAAAFRKIEEELTSGIRSRIEVLGTLNNTTGFDFDIASDLHPELVTDPQRYGKERREFWTGLYEGLAKNPKYTVLQRHATGLAPGCYGFGQTPEYTLKAAWIYIFKDLKQEDLVFSRDEQQAAQVTINSAAQAFIYKDSERENGVGVKNTVALFDASIGFGLLQEHAPEVRCDPNFSFYEDAATMLTDFSTIRRVNATPLYIPIHRDDVKSYFNAENPNLYSNAA